MTDRAEAAVAVVVREVVVVLVAPLRDGLSAVLNDMDRPALREVECDIADLDRVIH